MATAHAQPEPAKQPTTLAPYLRFDRVNGMAKGAVKAIVQDSDGFMWFGTDEGLSRYDGFEYINYVPGANNENTLGSFTVTALAATKGVLWIGTVKGLDRLDLATKKFSHFRSNPKDPSTIASDYITALEVGDKDTLWIGTNDAGVDALKISSGAVKHYRSDRVGADAVTDDAITALRQTVDGKLWVGTREAGLKILDPETGKVNRYGNDKAPTSLSSDEITSIYQDQEGVVWVGTLNGLDSFDAGTRTFKRR
ncbi:MAG TPA: two-component regulator propeller domain-containing protein, partial [Kofleriaceae bacterium]